jgi:hypothetical protein
VPFCPDVGRSHVVQPVDRLGLCCILPCVGACHHELSCIATASDDGIAVRSRRDILYASEVLIRARDRFELKKLFFWAVVGGRLYDRGLNICTVIAAEAQVDRARMCII